MAKSKGKAPVSETTGRSGLFQKRSTRSGQFVSVGPMPDAGFLAKTRLKKAGGSLVMTVPAAARNLLHLTEGQEMAVSVEGSKVVFEPVHSHEPMRVRRPRYTLEELLANANPDAPLSDEEQAWQGTPPVGREIW